MPKTLLIGGACLALFACDGTIGTLPDDDVDMDPGPGVDAPPPRLHRLNRLEYDNSVRDLLGTRLRPGSTFPPDGSSSGLDNIAESLTLTPTLLSAYYAAAAEVVDDALDTRPAHLVHRSAEDLPPVGEAVGPVRSLLGGELRMTERVPGGPVELVLSAEGVSYGADISPTPLTPNLQIEVDGGVVRTVVMREGAEHHVVPLDLTAGEHTFVFRPTNFVRQPAEGYGNDVLVASVELRGPNVPGPGVERVFVCTPEPPSVEPVEVRRHVRNPASFQAWRFGAVESTPTDGWADGPPMPLVPRVVISPGDPRVFVEDVDESGRVLRHVLNPTSLTAWRLNEQAFDEVPRSQLETTPIGLPWSLTPRLVQGATPHVYIVDSIAPVTTDDLDQECYRRITTTFARRAWRRALEADEADALHRFWRGLVDEGEIADQALRLTLRRILVAPDFIYRRRRGDTDLEWLAGRLSYFLWSSTPDEALMQAAHDGTLDDDDVLRAQVRRMLADDRAQAIVDGFGEQWLSTRRLDQLSPSAETFPEADAALMASMEAESKGFFRGFLRSERPVASMLDADFAATNDRLAAHYGQPLPGSDETQEVAASEGRASVLGLSAWLALHVQGDHPSPIQRGRWVSDHVLCEPVPPPPAGLEVPTIEFEGELTVREQLEMHRENEVCASCHVRLDILGMGFQRYDALGRVRDEPGLDSLGELPEGGGTFDGAEEMAAALDREAFVACVTRWLTTYALGRSPVGDENAVIDDIAAEATTEGWSLSEVLEAIALTDGFRGHEGDAP